MGLMWCLEVGEIFITCPPSWETRAAYSASGSQIMMSSFVTRKALVISRLAEKDLPEPGVPRIRPLGFLSRGTFQGMGKIRRESPRGRLKAVFGGR